jgi:hypothetical protein
MIENPLKTIFKRLRQYTIKDTIEDVNCKPKCIEILENHNIKIYKKNGEYRDLYDIISDVSLIWDELSEDEILFVTDIKPYIKR